MTQGTGDNSNRFTLSGNLTASCPNDPWDPYGYIQMYAEPNDANQVDFNKNHIESIEFGAHSDITKLGPISITIWDLKAANVAPKYTKIAVTGIPQEYIGMGISVDIYSEEEIFTWDDSFNDRINSNSFELPLIGMERVEIDGGYSVYPTGPIGLSGAYDVYLYIFEYDDISVVLIYEGVARNKTLTTGTVSIKFSDFEEY